MSLQDINVDGSGVRIKRLGKSFLVPFNKGKPKICHASHLINYMEVMHKSVTDLRPTDALFRAPIKVELCPNHWSQLGVTKNPN